MPRHKSVLCFRSLFHCVWRWAGSNLWHDIYIWHHIFVLYRLAICFLVVGPPTITLQRIRLTKSKSTTKVATIEALNMLTLCDSDPTFYFWYDHANNNIAQPILFQICVFSAWWPITYIDVEFWVLMIVIRIIKYAGWHALCRAGILEHPCVLNNILIRLVPLGLRFPKRTFQTCEWSNWLGSVEYYVYVHTEDFSWCVKCSI